MWTQLYLIFVGFLTQVITLWFNLFSEHIWIFIPLIVSFVCASVSLVLRLLMAVNNSAS